MNAYILIWSTFQLLLALTSGLSIILFFKEETGKILAEISIYLSILLNFLIFIRFQVYHPKMHFIKCVLYDYNLHVGINSIVFALTDNYRLFWRMDLGFSAFYQFLHLLVEEFFPTLPSINRFSSFLIQIYNYFSNPPRAEALLSFLDILSFIPVMVIPKKVRVIPTILAEIFYLFWYFMYRYSNSIVTKKITCQIFDHFKAGILKMPSFISDPILKIINKIKFRSIWPKLYADDS